MTLGDYAINFALFVPGVIVGRIVGGLVIGWLDARRARRIARDARPSITVEKYDEMLKAMYSSDRLGFPDCRRPSCPMCIPSREEKQP